MSLLAIDIGSSSCKAIAFSVDGRLLAQRSHSYSAEYPQPAWAEMNADRFWAAFQTVTRAIAGEVANDPIEVLAISSHGETFIPVDRHQQPVGPAILNIDNRALSEAAWLAQELGLRPVFETTGLSIHPMYPLPKILWLRDHQPDTFSRSANFLSVPSYLLARLRLPPYIDYSLASRFLAFDIGEKRWSGAILSACKLSVDLFSTPVPAGTVAGRLAADTATALNLRSGTMVVVGGHDQPCAALGCGVLESGRVSASLGTYECLLVASEAPALNDQVLSANLNSYCHVVPNRYVTLAYFPSGIMIDWFLHLLYPGEQLADAAYAGELCAQLEMAAPQHPTGLYITPHLLGTCNPDFDPRASGVVVGIRPSTSRFELYKGILEGIACEFAAMADLLRQVAGSFDDVYVTGGGGRSRLGLTLRASLSSLRLHLMQSPEAVCLGTAILAGVAAGSYTNFAVAAQQLVRIQQTIQPEATVANSYRAQLQQYRALYSALAPLRRAEASCHQEET